ncbi:MAG TPA: S9 family peptidase [Porphyromonadaceae bacterium]|jgi:dipeptidyl aminopeptidase/acylaminoacyl peptidase|nr:S9 family peptidase [Porphyromonadaceae bacterium]
MQRFFYYRPFVFITLLTLSLSSFSQKKQLDHSVYDNWKSLQEISISNDGRFINAVISPQEGDSTLYIYDSKKEKELLIHRVNKYTLSPDGRYTVALLKAPFSEIRQAKIKKKKADDFPKDSLVIVDNEAFTLYKIADVKSYATSTEMAGHIAYKKAAPKDTAKNKPNKPADLLIIRNLNTSAEDTVKNSKEFAFNKFGNSLAVSVEPEKKDSTDTHKVLFFDLKNGNKKQISGEKMEYRSFSFDEPGNQLVYLATKDTSKIEQKVFDVRYFKNTMDSAVVIASKTSRGLPENWIFNENSKPSFSKNGQRILVGAAPRQTPKDTTLVDFETAALDIWHWKDPVVQPQQLSQLKNELRRTYTGIIDPNRPREFISVANEQMPNASFSDEGNGRFVLLTSGLPYEIESQWDISSKMDTWIYDTQSNQLTVIAQPVSGRPQISPSGNFTYWWNASEKQWFAFDNKTGKTIGLTQEIPVNFWNEKNDTPSEPGAYGIAAWGEGDKFVLMYDAFDIWKLDPSGKQKPVNITNNAGRTDSITFRYINTDPDKRFVDNKDVLLLSAFDNISKEAGFYTLRLQGRNPLLKRELDKYGYTSVKKAKNTDLFVFQKSNFNTSPDLYITQNLWQSAKKLTDINPQMKEYNWGTTELIRWTAFDGKQSQGILYKPENFDPSKKYPVMIYFYEKHSDELYRYFAPAPSRSVINIPFFVSRGYIVFTPDIHYGVGQPGPDAYNYVVSGAQALAKNQWVDSENMAIQGQSWGGYQVAYLITQTNMFKAAGAGAPVSNMTSAYGGIRWETGRSRQFQYEQTQSRIGATMSDSLQLYIENSPVFFANKVNTPLLIMHNDNDGAVPWYQGIEYFMSLRRLGKPVWMLQYNKEAHNLNQRRNAKDLSIRLQQFFDHYLKGTPAPVWMTRGLPATEKGKSWGYDLEAGQPGN